MTLHCNPLTTGKTVLVLETIPETLSHQVLVITEHVRLILSVQKLADQPPMSHQHLPAPSREPQVHPQTDPHLV